MTYRKSSHSSKRSQFPDVFLTIACRELSLFLLPKIYFKAYTNSGVIVTFSMRSQAITFLFRAAGKKKRTSACIALRVRNKEGKKQQGIFVMASFARRTLTCLVLDASTFCYFFLLLFICLFFVQI